MRRNDAAPLARDADLIVGDDPRAASAPPAARDGRASPLQRTWLRLLALDEHAVILSLGLLCLFAANFFTPTDPDFWWHVRTGQLIAETGAVPHYDVYSYTAAGQPWVVHEWLAELLMYAVYALGGYVAAEAVFALVITCTYFLVYRLARALGLDRTPALAILVLAALVRLPVWAPRPQLFTFLLFTVFLHVLFVHKQAGRARLWLLPPLMLLWVNLHAGYIAGLLLIGLFIAGELLNRLTRRPAAAVRPLVVAGLASALASFVNPNPLNALLYPLSYVGTGNASMRFVAEWQSPDFHSPINFPLILALVLLMLVGSRRRLDFTAALLVLVFTAMALESARNAVFFGLAIAPVLALRLRERGFRLALEVRTGAKATPLLTLLPLVVVPLVLALVVVYSPRSQVGSTPRTDTYPYYPVGGVAYLREHRPPGHLFNSYVWGGYLIYTLYPDYPVFIDGRADPYGDAVMEDYGRVVMITPGWRAVLDKYQVATVLIEKNSPFAVLLAGQPDWQMVFEGPVEQIFIRWPSPAGAG